MLQTKLRPSEEPAEFEAQLEESFALLGVDTIDLLSLHGLNSPNCVDLTLRAGGSCGGGGQVPPRRARPPHRLLDARADAPADRHHPSDRFDYVNLHAYYLFQDNLPAIAAARERDMGVFIISPTDKGGRLYAPSEKLRKLTAPLSPMAFNDLWCLTNLDVHTLSLGAAVPSDFDAHVEALALLDDAPRLLPPIVARLEAAYAERAGRGLRAPLVAGPARMDGAAGQDQRAPHPLAPQPGARLRPHPLRAGALHLDEPQRHWVPGARAVDFNDAEMTAALPDRRSAPRSRSCSAAPTRRSTTRR